MSEPFTPDEEHRLREIVREELSDAIRAFVRLIAYDQIDEFFRVDRGRGRNYSRSSKRADRAVVEQQGVPASPTDDDPKGADVSDLRE